MEKDNGLILPLEDPMLRGAIDAQKKLLLSAGHAEDLVKVCKTNSFHNMSIR